MDKQWTAGCAWKITCKICTGILGGEHGWRQVGSGINTESFLSWVICLSLIPELSNGKGLLSEICISCSSENKTKHTLTTLVVKGHFWQTKPRLALKLKRDEYRFEAMCNYLEGRNLSAGRGCASTSHNGPGLIMALHRQVHTSSFLGFEHQSQTSPTTQKADPEDRRMRSWL